MDAKERKEAEKDSDEKDDDIDDEEGGLVGAPLEYYDDFFNSDRVGAPTTTVLRDGNSGAD